ncbi:protein bicaudal D-like [Dendronephthya gigantea]|uniref:protein bicaudal D-like n=1 Tax=Dendronephthya gigantea TaxID=151771 RepID=UPI001068DFBA|nr:protein bicaudal D-like [Dendronephthya gigantea]
MTKPGTDPVNELKTTKITSFFGFPWKKTVCIEHTNKKLKNDEMDKLDDFNWSALVLIATVVAIMAFIWALVGEVRNCPKSGRIDLSGISSRECQESLGQVEVAHKTTKQQVEKLNKDIAILKEEKANFSRKLDDTEKELREIREQLRLAKQEKDNLVQENSLLKTEKETIKKDLSSAQFTLGNCKNKNMDHEVQNLELLQEIESLKKELKAC